MAVVRELVTKLEFKANLRPIDRTLAKVKRLKAAFSKFLLGPAGVIGAIFTGAGLAVFGFVNSVAGALDKTAKLAKSLSINAQFLQELAFAADLSGVSQDQLGTAILKLSRSMKEAGDDVTTYTDIFDDDLKVAVKDANGELKTVEELLPDIADAFKNTIPETKKTAIALELFGRAGAAMLPLLNEGSKGIEKMRKEARKLGIVFGEETLAQAEAFKDEMLRFQSTLKAVATTIGVAFLPDMRALIETFRKFIVENRKIIKQKIISFLETMSFVGGVLTGIFLVLGKVLKKTFDFILQIPIIGSILNGLGNVITGTKEDIKSLDDQLVKAENNLERFQKRIGKRTSLNIKEKQSLSRLIGNVKKLKEERARAAASLVPETAKLKKLRSELEILRSAGTLRSGRSGGSRGVTPFQRKFREVEAQAAKEFQINIVNNIRSIDPVATGQEVAKAVKNTLTPRLLGR